VSTHRWAAKRDAAEGPIVEALRAVGAQVWFISGKGLPDLLVRYKGRLEAGEVKSKGGKETENQGDFPIWRKPEDALAAIGIR